MQINVMVKSIEAVAVLELKKYTSNPVVETETIAGTMLNKWPAVPPIDV